MTSKASYPTFDEIMQIERDARIQRARMIRAGASALVRNIAQALRSVADRFHGHSAA